MADRVELAFRRAAARLTLERGPLVVAVSGGSDSIALLHLVARFRTRRPEGVVVAHLDHGLRRGSRTDRRFVERVAAALGLAVVADRREVGDLRRRGESVEEAARRVRLGFLREVARGAGADVVALGHTRDDQAETVLLRLLRGAGPAALAGMHDRGPAPFVRPLLEFERDDLRAYLTRRGLDWREDPTNRDDRFDRNRIRRRLLPYLGELGFPRAGRALVRAADVLREDAALLDAMARRRFSRLRRGRAGGGFTIDVAGLARLEPPIARRVIRVALRDSGVSEKAASSRLVAAVLDLAQGPRGRRLDLPGDVVVARVADRLEWRFGSPE